MSLMVEQYDSETGKYYAGPLHTNDLKPSRVLMQPFGPVLKRVSAHDRLKNAQQNIGRAATTWSDRNETLAVNTFLIPVFENKNTIGHEMRMFQDEYCPLTLTKGMAFVNQEPGCYNVKAGISVEISEPAVPATKITKAECYLVYSPRDRSSYSILWQDTVYSQTRVIPGFPETTENIYLRGWSHTPADKVWMECGDLLWIVHKFHGLNNITYLETFEARIAIQRTGEPFEGTSCCTT